MDSLASALGRYEYVRVVLLFLLSALLLMGDTFKLYLKDGGFQLTREYHVEGDRIRYFSTERGEWEEIPVELVDLAKTEREQKTRHDQAENDAKAEDEEEKAERAQKREIASIPMEPGAYFKTDKGIENVPSADFQTVTDKKRKALQIASPIPLVPGKALVLIKGEHAKFVVNDDKPAFFLRQEKEERFAIVKVTPHKTSRIVENISILPVVKQQVPQRLEMDTFNQQLADGLFRVWPEKPLSPGEYALIEFDDDVLQGEVELLVWDFAYQPSGK